MKKEMNGMESKAKVFIVDDEESLRFLYAEALREEGYEPIPVKNGKEAILMLKDTKPDLIVLDIIMPVMDGMEALDRIIGQYKEIPIILNSSYLHYKDNFMSRAADGYLTKSSDLKQLKGTIRNLLEQIKGKGLTQLQIS
jgi:CheY-like chemotaxis protein